MISERGRKLNILLVEDNPFDIFLTKRALEDSKINLRLHVVENGADAVHFLHQKCIQRDTDIPCPDLVLLDLNLPGMSGTEVLEEIKGNPFTLHIPVIVLTTSDEPRDICEAYFLQANCFITKPVDVDQFTAAVQSIEKFWTEVAKLPPDSGT
ncbi:response regulator [Desulfomonile tiedjei]|uniref:Response regulator containing a CheY-like receiver domain and an HD-GYP domain n=1 Tax=Desulfomonile tiedjei (strain ATCC 49306 / DSM 6799 / DCB-1) TaxID=706587 RepID=I4C583_DESTA|nr:response regulator [Desulfomonile tiedjei]AFM24724.1 response regulator containing a CheY-like receiver domain and an HD-GYP domain [Desulfomonile tiedjei DSM 6799]